MYILKNIKFKSVWLALLCMLSVNGCFESCENGQVKNQVNSANSVLKNEGSTKRGQQKKHVIVLLHGLNGMPEDLATMAAELKKAFPQSTVLNIETKDTKKRAIKEQVADLYNQNKTKLDAPDVEIDIVGYSAGGLRGIVLAKKLKNVKGLCTIGTPLQGAPIAESLQNQELYNKAKNLPFGLGKYVQNFNPNTPAAKELIPNSTFLQEIKHSLANSSIPMLAIGGDVTSTDSPMLYLILNTILSKYGIDETYQAIICGKNGSDDASDLLIPLKSQCPEIPNPNFDTKIFPVSHISINSSRLDPELQLSLPPGLSTIGESESDEVIQAVIAFINQNKN